MIGAGTASTQVITHIGRCVDDEPDNPANNLFSSTYGSSFDLFKGAGAQGFEYYDDHTDISGIREPNKPDEIILTNSCDLSSNGYCSTNTMQDCESDATPVCANNVWNIYNTIRKNKEISRCIRILKEQGNRAEIVSLLSAADNRMSKRLLMPIKLEDASYEEAQVLLNELPLETEEDRAFEEYYRTKYEVQSGSSTKDIFNVSAAQEAKLLVTAEGKTETAYKAQAWLYLLKGITYPVQLPDISENGDITTWQTTFKTNNNNTHATLNKASVFSPNPLKNTTQLKYYLGKDEIGTLSIYSLNGLLIEQTNVTGTGNYTIQQDQLDAGLYLYVFSVNGEAILREKLIVIK